MLETFCFWGNAEWEWIGGNGGIFLGDMVWIARRRMGMYGVDMIRMMILSTL